MPDEPKTKPAPAKPASAAPASVITQDQMTAAIEKARLEERDKLRTQMDKSSDSATTLEASVAVLTADRDDLAKKLDELVTTHDALKAGMKTDGKIDVEKAITQAVEAASERINKATESRIAALDSALADERNFRKTTEAGQLRSRLIEAAGGEATMIPEMVSGDTEEALVASIAASQGVYNRTIAKATPAAVIPDPNASAAPIVPAVMPVAPNPVTSSAAAGGPIIESGVRELSTAEYALKRNELRKKVSGRYGAMNPVT